MKIHIVLVLAALCAAACNSQEQEKGTAPVTIDQPAATQVTLTDEQLKNAGIRTGKAYLKDMHTLLRVNGNLEVPPENRYTISFPIGGYLKTSKLVPGVQVNKGAVLATLEDARYIQLQQDYLVNKSKLGYLEADFKRQEELNKTQSNSDKIFQQAKAEYESQKVLVRSLHEQLKLIGIDPGKLNENTISRTVNIYAPISGYVSKINVNPGKYVAPADVLFELIDPSRLQLHLTVFEKDVQSLQPGQKVICYTNANPEKKIAATIQLINQRMGDDRSVEVTCLLEQPGLKLMPGTYMNAEIQQNNAAVRSLPESAVVRWQNNYYVFVAASPNTFTMQQVETGNTVNGFVQISSTLPSNDIVLENAYALLMMLKNTSE